MVGDKLWVIGTTPGFRASVDVASPAADTADTLRQTRDFNQQRETQLAHEQEQRAERTHG